MRARQFLFLLALACTPSCKACEATTVTSKAWTPPAAECKDYRFKEQISGEVAMLTVTKAPADASPAFIATVTYKKNAEGTFAFDNCTPPQLLTDAPPKPAIANVSSGKVCLRFDDGDDSPDACLRKLIEAGKSQDGACALVEPTPE